VFKAHKKTIDQQKAEQDLYTELKKLNTTVLIIPGGYIGYVQVLDVSCNKIMKKLITEAKETHYDNYKAKYKANKFSVGNRRVLLTHWVAKAWQDLHEFHSETIINTF
jgi:hypothetical protein